MRARKPALAAGWSAMGTLRKLLRREYRRVRHRDLQAFGPQERRELRASLDVGRQRLRTRTLRRTRGGHRDGAVTALGEARERTCTRRARLGGRDGRQTEQA